MWVLGIDAGGTKTHCAIAGMDGKIVAEGYAGTSNYQLVGDKATEIELKKAIEEALLHAKLDKKDITIAVFGMSGADEERDFQILEPMAKRLLENSVTKVVHDSWIGFRAASDVMVGVVSICGTSAGHSGKNLDGVEFTLRNLDYETGNYGGGIDLANQALHYAFRSNEGTYKKTILEEKMPALFGVDNMNDVCNYIRENGVTKEKRHQIPFLVFESANNGDIVSRMLIEKMGYEEGLYGAGIVRRLGLEQEKIPAVLIGGLFQSGNQILVDAYMKGIREAAPLCYPVVLDKPPVIGAIMLALEAL